MRRIDVITEDKTMSVCEEGILEAEFFLNKLKSQRLGPEFTYFLKAFLTSCVGILDYLLEDANRIFSLNIPEKERIRIEFKEAAKNRREANEFYEWWQNKVKELEDSEAGFLIRKRHIAVHRKSVRPDLVKVTVEETIHLSDSVRLEVYDRNGRLIRTYESPKQEIKPPKNEKISIEAYFFKENGKELPIIPTCEKLLEDLRKLVEEAKQKFF